MFSHNIIYFFFEGKKSRQKKRDDAKMLLKPLVQTQNLCLSQANVDLTLVQVIKWHFKSLRTE